MYSHVWVTTPGNFEGKWQKYLESTHQWTISVIPQEICIRNGIFFLKQYVHFSHISRFIPWFNDKYDFEKIDRNLLSIRVFVSDCSLESVRLHQGVWNLQCFMIAITNVSQFKWIYEKFVENIQLDDSSYQVLTIAGN